MILGCLSVRFFTFREVRPSMSLHAFPPAVISSRAGNHLFVRTGCSFSFLTIASQTGLLSAIYLTRENGTGSASFHAKHLRHARPLMLPPKPKGQILPHSRIPPALRQQVRSAGF